MNCHIYIEIEVLIFILLLLPFIINLNFKKVEIIPRIFTLHFNNLVKSRQILKNLLYSYRILSNLVETLIYNVFYY
jgi:hypothetical protein